MSISLISIFLLIYFIVMVSFSTAGSVQLSPQVSECLSLDLGLLSFIRESLARHRAGDFGQVYGPEFESTTQAFEFGGRYRSIYQYQLESSLLYGHLIRIVSPGARDTTFVSFVEELQ